MANPATSEQHEWALRHLTMEKEMCCDIARKHAAKLPARERVRCARRYEEIARGLLCKRAKPLSILQQVRKNGLVERIKQSDHAEQRRVELMEELVAASLLPIHFPAPIEGLASRRKRMGKHKFYCRLNAIIGRYVSARIIGATWAAPLSLLQLLAIERDRDRESLWSFLEDFFERWEKTSAPKGTHRMGAIILELLAGGHNMKEVQAALEKVGFRLSADGIKRYATVRAKASRLRSAALLPLLEVLALEWSRDRKSLRSYLEDSVERWEETSAPMGTHRRHAIILELLADGHIKQVEAALEKVEFSLSADGIKRSANVRALASCLRRVAQQFKEKRVTARCD